MRVKNQEIPGDTSNTHTRNVSCPPIPLSNLAIKAGYINVDRLYLVGLSVSAGGDMHKIISIDAGEHHRQQKHFTCFSLLSSYYL